MEQISTGQMDSIKVCGVISCWANFFSRMFQLVFRLTCLQQWIRLLTHNITTSQLLVWKVKMLRKRRMRKRRVTKSQQRGEVWKSSPSLKNRRPSSRRIPVMRHRCPNGSSPSPPQRGIGSARSRTRTSSWKRNPSSQTAAVTALRASRSPVTSSGNDIGVWVKHKPENTRQPDSISWEMV